MSFLGRSKYNLLQYKKKDDPNLHVQEWQIRDYRILKNDELFQELRNLGTTIDENVLRACKERNTSPEELACQFPENIRGEAYLFLFELWRRFCPEQKTLSIFCDDLDAFISAYDQGDEPQDDSILTELFDILDESVDEGQKPKVVFKQLKNYLAHDLENFFYNYIYDQIDKGNELGASELLESIHEYVEGSLWFDFLQLRLLRGAPSEDATAMMARFLEKLAAHPDRELSFELLYYLIETGHKELFVQTYKNVLKQIQTEEHFMEMLEILFSFYTLNELEKEENLIRELIQKRKHLSPDQKVAPEDKQALGDLL